MVDGPSTIGNEECGVAIGSYREEFIKKRVYSGRYEPEGDVMRAALHLFEQQETELEFARSKIVTRD